MPQEIRLWTVEDNKMPMKVDRNDIGLEKRLHDWLEKDISILDDRLLVIGREVEAHDRQKIDLLCIESDGALVVVEVKRRRTPREVAAQALEYASWVKELTADQVKEIANEYLQSDGPLESAMAAKFGTRPETLNGSHRSLIVAEEIGGSTERIVRYLSELGVPINVATVQAFKDAGGQEMLAQVFLVEPEIARARASSRKSGYLKAGEMEALADSNGLGDLYRRVRNASKVLKAPRGYYTEQTSYGWRFEDGGVRTVLMVSAVKQDNGGLQFEIHATRFDDYMGVPLDDLRAMLPTDVREDIGVRGWRGSSEEERKSAVGLKGAFHTLKEVDTFVDKLDQAVRRDETDRA